MTIAGYEIPMISTIMPWALGILFVCAIKIFAARMWKDRDIELKKVGLLLASIGLIFFGLLSMDNVITWVGGLVGKAMEVVNKINV